MTNFYKLPSWLVWTLVSLGVLLLCAVWQWRRAMSLLDKTSKELEHKKAELGQVKENLSSTIALQVKQNEIKEEAAAKVEEAEAEKEEAIKKGEEGAQLIVDQVEEAGTAVPLLKARRQGRGKKPTAPKEKNVRTRRSP
jgi:hypothetical protein